MEESQLMRDLAELLRAIKRREDAYVEVAQFARKKVHINQEEDHDQELIERMLKELAALEQELLPLEGRILGGQDSQQDKSTLKYLINRLCHRFSQLFQVVEERIKSTPLYTNELRQSYRAVYESMELAISQGRLAEFKRTVVQFSRGKLEQQRQFLEQLSNKLQRLEAVQYSKIYLRSKKDEGQRNSAERKESKGPSPERGKAVSVSDQNKAGELKQSFRVKMLLESSREKQKFKRLKLQFMNRTLMKNYSTLDLCRHTLLQNITAEGEEGKDLLFRKIMQNNDFSKRAIQHYSQTIQPQVLRANTEKALRRWAEKELELKREAQLREQSSQSKRIREVKKEPPPTLRRKKLYQAPPTKAVRPQQKSINTQRPSAPVERYSLIAMTDHKFQFNFSSVERAKDLETRIMRQEERPDKAELSPLSSTNVSNLVCSRKPSPEEKNLRTYKLNSVLLNSHEEVQKVNVLDNQRLDIMYYKACDKKLADLRSRLRYRDNRLVVE